MSAARDLIEHMRGVTSNIQTQITSKRAGDATVNNSTWLGADLEVSKGGTGASSASAARNNLGLEIGVDILASGAPFTPINYQSSATIPTSTTINSSAYSFGEITVADGVTVTVGASGTWTFI